MLFHSSYNCFLKEKMVAVGCFGKGEEKSEVFNGFKRRLRKRDRFVVWDLLQNPVFSCSRDHGVCNWIQRYPGICCLNFKFHWRKMLLRLKPKTGLTENKKLCIRSHLVHAMETCMSYGGFGYITCSFETLLFHLITIQEFWAYC